jgi:hypothetical protein
MEKPAAIEILTIGYRAKCIEACGNLARNIVRETDNGGRPLTNLELCLFHTTERIDIAQRAGLKVHDSRK